MAVNTTSRSSSSSRTTRRQRGEDQRSPVGILGLMDQRQQGTGLYSRTNVGTQPTARMRANEAGTFARAVDPQGTLEDRPSPQDVRDPFVDNATRRGIRSGIEDQSELRQDLVSGGGMNPVEYRAGLQALQATNQGLQPLMEQRTATDTAEMQEIGSTNRQLLGIDNTRMQGAMNLAQQAMQGDQQMDLARLEGGLALDETLMGGMADREVAAIEGQYSRQQAAMENALSPAERMRLQLINEETQAGGLSGLEAIDALGGEPIEAGPEELVEMADPENPTQTLMVPRSVAQNAAYARLAQTEEGRSALALQDPESSAGRFLQGLREREAQEAEGSGMGFWSGWSDEETPNVFGNFVPGATAFFRGSGQRRQVGGLFSGEQGGNGEGNGNGNQRRRRRQQNGNGSGNSN